MLYCFSSLCYFILCSQKDSVITDIFPHLRDLYTAVLGCSPTLLTKGPLWGDKSFHCV